MIVYFLAMFIAGAAVGAATASMFSHTDDRYSEGFNSGLEYAKHKVKRPDEEE